MLANIEIRSLAPLLDAFVRRANAIINSIPETIAPDEEGRLIDAASAGAVAIAQRIVALPASLAEDIAIKAKAAAWLDGALWS
jgi:hypothetical protein